MLTLPSTFCLMFHFIYFFFLMFKYSFLPFPPTVLHHPSPPHLLPVSTLPCYCLHVLYSCSSLHLLLHIILFDFKIAKFLYEKRDGTFWNASKGMKNLFEKIMKENFPNLANEIRLPGSPGSSESPKEAGPKEEHTKAHHHYIIQD